MSHTHSNLATLIGSRICHDLISPIGAIHNGLELLELSGGMSQTPEMQLIVESCANARARVTFFDWPLACRKARKPCHIAC